MRYIFSILSVCLLLNSVEAKAVTLDEIFLTSSGQSRSYNIFVPSNAPKRNSPIVIMLHGGGGNGQNAADMTGFAEYAAKQGFIAVFPNGAARGNMKLRTWNAAHCCGYAMKSNAKDVAFLTDVIDDVVKRYNANPEAVFMTGLSNGGMMTQYYSMARPDKIKAAAPVISGLFGDENPSNQPVPMLIINGALDESIPLNGGHTNNRFKDQWSGKPLMPVAYQGLFWAKNNGCAVSSAPNKVVKPNLTTYIYDCPKNAAVYQYIVEDAGHSWPSGKGGTKRADPPSQAMNATEVIWAFFKSYL